MIATLVTPTGRPHLVACWDDDWRPQFRVDLIPTYKTHRLVEGSDVVEESPDDLTPQVPLIREALEAVGITRLGAPASRRTTSSARSPSATAASCPSTSSPGTVTCSSSSTTRTASGPLPARAESGNPDIATQSYLLERYAVPTGDAYVDMSILRGDTSDGFPGVKGIGDKTAAQLIATYGSLQGLRAAVANGDPALKGVRRANLEATAAYLDVAPTVVRVARDAPVADVDLALPRAVADPDRLERWRRVRRVEPGHPAPDRPRAGLTAAVRARGARGTFGGWTRGGHPPLAGLDEDHTLLVHTDFTDDPGWLDALARHRTDGGRHGCRAHRRRRPPVRRAHAR